MLPILTRSTKMISACDGGNAAAADSVSGLFSAYVGWRALRARLLMAASLNLDIALTKLDEQPRGHLPPLFSHRRSRFMQGCGEG